MLPLITENKYTDMGFVIKIFSSLGYRAIFKN